MRNSDIMHDTKNILDYIGLIVLALLVISF